MQKSLPAQSYAGRIRVPIWSHQVRRTGLGAPPLLNQCAFGYIW